MRFVCPSVCLCVFFPAQAENSALSMENDNQRKQYERCLDEVSVAPPKPRGERLARVSIKSPDEEINLTLRHYRSPLNSLLSTSKL